MCDMPHLALQDPAIKVYCHISKIKCCECVPRLINMCAMTHSSVCYRALQSRCAAAFPKKICHVPWLMNMCAMTHFCVCYSVLQSGCAAAYGQRYGANMCHDSSICVPWLIHMCAMTHKYVCHGSSMCVPIPMNMCAMTHQYVCRDLFVTLCTTGVMSHIWMSHVTQGPAIHVCCFISNVVLCIRVERWVMAHMTISRLLKIIRLFGEYRSLL